MSTKTQTARELALLLGAKLPNANALNAGLSRVSSMEEATSDAVVFTQTEAALQLAMKSSAGLILANFDDVPELTDTRVLRVSNPKLAFVRCAGALSDEAGELPLVHPTAVIDSTAVVGEKTRIGAGAVIEANVVLGSDCVIGSRVTICPNTVVGDSVTVQSGTVLGATGFGYVRNPDTGGYLLFPQQGRLVIEDDVEIGANTTIDRGALGETRIGSGTKIDNLVHIGHNCRIGKHVLIAAQVGMSGSCVIGDGAILAGQVGLSDHVTIGAGVIVGGQAGVYTGKTIKGEGEIFAGTPAEPLRAHLSSLAKLRRLK